MSVPTRRAGLAMVVLLGVSACGGEPTVGTPVSSSGVSPAAPSSAASSAWKRQPEIKVDDARFGFGDRVGDEIWVSGTAKGAAVVFVFDAETRELKETVTKSKNSLAAADNVNAIAVTASAVFLDTGAGNLHGIDRATHEVAVYRQLPAAKDGAKPGKPVSTRDGKAAYVAVGETVYELDKADGTPVRTFTLSNPGVTVPSGSTTDYRLLGVAGGLVWYGAVVKTTPLSGPPVYDRLLTLDPASGAVKPFQVKADGTILGPETVGDKVVFSYLNTLWVVDPRSGEARELPKTRLAARAEASSLKDVDGLSTYGDEVALIDEGLIELVDLGGGASTLVPSECDVPKPEFGACVYGDVVMADDSLWAITPSALVVFTR
ncbi:hypothetical protein GCM10022243_29440 [Saccharothrix violaceirubra]|uniref:Uncharacterized protein n=1 Tax=Saccharothrix violaceirubra TaxID=413306 RepID=A0A7W7T5Y0_9PSEU|nr:hypothetical protein [Saccharothrix violaceirubra]MBB4966567.1 hypothetical protein [Saccharothrix violaceirubra]